MTDTPDRGPVDPEPDAAPQEDAPRFGKKQIIAGILTLLVLVLVFVVVLPQFGDYAQAWSAIQEMSTAALATIIVATVAMIIIYVWPYPAAHRGLRFRPAFVVRQTSFMISNVIPAGGAIGLAIQYGMLQSYSVPPAASAATIGVTGVWNSFITLTLPVVALVGLFIIGSGTAQASVVVVLAALAVVVAIFVFALILRKESTARAIGDWASRLVTRLARIVRQDVHLDLGQALVDFRESIVDVVAGRWLLITVANLAQQLAQFSILYFAVVALQGSLTDPINIAEALAAFAFGRLATFIPIPPGGLGTTDAIIVSILTGFGLPSDTALAANMVWRAMTYFPQVIIGTVTFLVWRRHQGKHGSTAAA